MSASPSFPLPPLSRIGILGGGQLGRMLATAAARLGLHCHIYTPRSDDPATLVAANATIADYTDLDALADFAAAVDVVTFEFENVDGTAVEFLQRERCVRPDASALITCQDRILEKSFLADIGAPVGAFRPIDDADMLTAALAELGLPAVLKTRRMGYDGKGQVMLGEGDDPLEAWAAIGKAPAILEQFVAFDCELSVIVARSADGEIAAYDPSINEHENHILKRSIVPADLPPDLLAQAVELAGRIVTELHYVGVMGVELFYCSAPEPALFVNELAPRVHNSGHWTLDGCTVSQFEQHIRAICGWPLGSTRRHSDAVMENLLGDEVEAWLDRAADPDTALHIYGKGVIVPGRKLGHITRLAPKARS